MCGICGIFGKEVSLESVKRMIATMRHRGPDDDGVYVDNSIAIGMARLSIIDLSDRAHQPMSNHNRTVWIVFNGEIYNYKLKRKELEKKGHKFISNSDTEVILKLYEEYNTDFIHQLQGIFALAIYDKRRGNGKERLLLARDHLGIKPLLYTRSSNKFIFSSEIKSIISSGLVKGEVDPEALRLLLTFGFIAQPKTIIKNVYALKPGQMLTIENDCEQIENYWEIKKNRIKNIRYLKYTEQVNLLEEKLVETLKLQMVSDVPIGTFLSGGVDSSLLTAIIAKLFNGDLQTFSVGFEKEGRYIDESADAKAIADYIGTDHSHVMVTGKDVFERINHIASALDQPTIDGVNSYFVSYAASKKVKVAISGTGGDELFAGYPWFMAMVLINQSKNSNLYKKAIPDKIPAFFQKSLFDKLCGYGIENYIERLRRISGFLPYFARQHTIYGINGCRKILNKQIKLRSNIGRELSHDINISENISEYTTIEKVSALCLRGYTQNQLLRDIDAVSMAHSLEVRVPFLDHVFVDYAFSLPDNAKIGELDKIDDIYSASYRETKQKRILVDIGKKLLPKDIDLQAKRGFGMPFDKWLNGPLREVMEDTLSKKSIISRGYFDYKEVKNIKHNFLNDKCSWVFPWLLIITELWSREVLDKNYTSS